jgi:hypothetical protein
MPEGTECEYSKYFIFQFENNRAISFFVFRVFVFSRGYLTEVRSTVLVSFLRYAHHLEPPLNI